MAYLHLRRWKLDRRTFLRGAGGTIIGLPFLDAMQASAYGAPVAKPPVRLGFIMLGPGVNVDHWFPKEGGKNYRMTRGLKPLERHREHFSVITGTTHLMANNHGHRAGHTWLTGSNYMTTGKNTISVDQLASETLGVHTRFPSLQWGLFNSTFNMTSWSREGIPLPTEESAIAIFERLFTDKFKADPARRRLQLARHQSILDGVTAAARDLNQKLGTADRDKLNQYFTSVREIEQRLLRAEQWIDTPPPEAPLSKPAVAMLKDDHAAYLRTIYDLMIAAWQTDSSRVVAFTAYGSGIGAGVLDGVPGVTEAWHPLTHHNGDPDKLEQLAKIDEYHSEQFAYFIDRLKAVKEADGSSLLDNVLVLHGDPMTDGGSHWSGNFPLLLAGHGGGLKQGQHLMLAQPPERTPDSQALSYKVAAGRVPTSNLFISMLNAAGVPASKFADSTGPLAGLT